MLKQKILVLNDIFCLNDVKMRFFCLNDTPMTKKHCLESFRSGNLNNFCTEQRKSAQFDMRSEQNKKNEIRD